MPETVPCGLCRSTDAQDEALLTEMSRLGEQYRIQSCLNCGFVYESPRPAPDELGPLYNNDPYWAPARNAGRPRRRRFDAARFARLERWTDGPGSLLVMACLEGGYLMQNARYRGWDTLGVEFVVGPLQHATDLGLPMVRSELWDLDVVDRQFDAIYTHSLEHVPDVPATLRQFRDHLNPGGFVLIEAPNQFEALKEVAKARLLAVAGERLLDHVYREVNQFLHLSFFSPRTLSSAVEDAGFEVVATRTYTPWNPVYHGTPRFRVTKELVYLLGGLIDRGPSIELTARVR